MKTDFQIPTIKKDRVFIVLIMNNDSSCCFDIDFKISFNLFSISFLVLIWGLEFIVTFFFIWTFCYFFCWWKIWHFFQLSVSWNIEPENTESQFTKSKNCQIIKYWTKKLLHFKIYRHKLIIFLWMLVVFYNHSW